MKKIVLLVNDDGEANKYGLQKGKVYTVSHQTIHHFGLDKHEGEWYRDRFIEIPTKNIITTNLFKLII